MVRIKHRYLLLNILFPGNSSPSSSSSSSSSAAKPFSLIFNSPSPPHFQAASLITLIRDSVTELFGDYGAGVIAGLKIIYFSPATSTAIVRCPRTSYRVVWAGLTFVNGFPGGRRGPGGPAERVDCVIRVVRVSGTIRKAEEEAVRRARREIVRAKLLEGEGGDASGTGGLERFLRLGQGGNSGMGRIGEEDAEEEVEEVGVGDISDGGDNMDDDSG